MSDLRLLDYLLDSDIIYKKLTTFRMQKICLLLSLIIILVSCAEDFDRFTADPLTGDIQNFYDGLQPDFQIYIVDNSDDVVVQLDDSNLIRIPSFSYEDNIGNAVEDLEVRVFTLDNAGDYIQNQIVTQDNAEVSLPLLGIKIEVYKSNGQSHTPEDLLSLQDDTTITIQVSSPELNNPIILKTYINSTRNVITQNIAVTEWTYDTDLETRTDSGYAFSIDNNRWYTLSESQSRNNPVEVSINLPPLYDDFNSVMYAITIDKIAVVQLDLVEDATYTGIIYTDDAAAVDVICISHQQGDDYHLGTKTIYITDDRIINDVLVPSAISKGEIINFLDSL